MPFGDGCLADRAARTREIPQACEGQHRGAVGRGEQVRVAVGLLAGPLEKAGGGDDAAALFEGVAEHGGAATVSARALKVAGTSFSVSFQKNGKR
jgi:hypothetical protein